MTLPIIICQVCDVALFRLTDTEGTAYIHSLVDPVDHDVVPVEAGPDWRGRCDFCHEPDADFVLPAKDFAMPYHPERMSLEDWAACDTCADLIREDRWVAITVRSIRSVQARHGIILGLPARTNLAAMHRALREQVSGPIRRVGDR